MMLNLDREISIVACVKSLTDAVGREKGRSNGAWLADPAMTFLRAELYNRNGLKGWNYADDREAARRLLIWRHKGRS